MESRAHSIDTKKRIIQIAISKLGSWRTEMAATVSAEGGKGEFLDGLYRNALAELEGKMAALENGDDVDID